MFVLKSHVAPAPQLYIRHILYAFHFFFKSIQIILQQILYVRIQAVVFEILFLKLKFLFLCILIFKFFLFLFELNAKNTRHPTVLIVKTKLK